MERKQSLLIITHQGFSFVEEISALLRQVNVIPCIVSSRPQREERIQLLHSLSEFVHVSNDLSLTFDEVASFVASVQPTLNLIGCIATYEGYRLTMAKINEMLNAVDSSTKSIAHTLDKYLFRQHLLDHKLSSCNSYLLDEKTLNDCKESQQRLFIKPRRGAASFSSFPLNKHVTWSFIQEQIRQIKDDATFSSMFMDNFDFIAEDFIGGQEFSYEVVQLDNEIYIVAIHEKTTIEALEFSVLERGLVSPPVSTINEHWHRAKTYLSEVLNCLGTTNGVFHIEAKFDETTNQFELIEINPRMGGSLINSSIELLNGKYSMLDLWIKLLSATHSEQRLELAQLLTEIEQQAMTSEVSSYIQIFYADAGKTIHKVHTKESALPPHQFGVHVKAGMQTPDSNREIFAAEGIWALPRVTNLFELEELVHEFEEIFTIEYV
ncbi:ATP-grasp domain-containing protein (plasmid) [Pseudoalteromonas xiamenensis]|uniref:ATP-grasp domain-containing protein n=1 Tax=Pseudoalteromonas xiamenensis TaxID=882626 RepID=UPI0027E3E8FB|nr:ATP-grasp domain-containing protein [Pseudoalteromonas xiamenensis]WMN61725.1 ATP-grasp domain-containing protein [Pseudoalteromonas xiamenensis]